MVGLIYTFNSKKKVIVLNYKIKLGIYNLEECPYKGLIYYSCEEFNDIKTTHIEGSQIVLKAKENDLENMLIEGLIKIYFSNIAML